MKNVYIGCCGFPCARNKYYKLFNVVELQNTFYELPSKEWANELRKNAPPGFIFTMKAFQAITHPSTSLTWKRMKRKLPGDLSNYGFLKPSKENMNALEETMEIARVLNAKIVVFQTPPNMPYNEQVVKWVMEFFERTRSFRDKNICYGWEPRGEWAKSAKLKDILSKYEIIHVVDVFRHRPLNKPGGIFYTRLHGLGKDEVNYRYNYTHEDLGNLINMLREEEFKEGFVMFNNVKMLDNALSLKEMLKEKRIFNVF
ncbi:MAG: DUF72 domain-containing protein [Desulfurococcaceae archaeon]